eukprot:scaffold132412_cov26-Tisochrysis_lutea.AAC.4
MHSHAPAAHRRALDSRMESEILSHAFTKRTSGKSDDRAAAAAAESAASKTAGEVSRTRPATPPRSASANSEKSLPSRSGLSRPCGKTQMWMRLVVTMVPHTSSKKPKSARTAPSP